MIGCIRVLLVQLVPGAVSVSDSGCRGGRGPYGRPTACLRLGHRKSPVAGLDACLAAGGGGCEAGSSAGLAVDVVAPAGHALDMRRRGKGGRPVTQSPTTGFGLVLRRLRIDAGLTQEELAGAARVSPRT